MSTIKILSAIEAQKIAAGEVVERPANIVKELLENSIDAQATVITLSIKKGGKEWIRIIDNGQGMSPEDAQLCFVKHATSKITSVDELETINTFGFRGEALASISAISKVTLRTRTGDARHATEVKVADGVQHVTHTAGTKGTEIIIEDVFYNVPARKKFLKTDATEYRQIQQLLYAFCLLHTNIHFIFYSENNMVLNCSPTNDLLKRAQQLWQPMVTEKLLAVEGRKKDIQIQGIISNYQHGLYDRSQLFFMVNNRWVKNQKLASALLKGYHNVLPKDRFPLVCIHITLPATEVDINIHPRKEEIRFLHPVLVEQALQQTVKLALEQTAPSNDMILSAQPALNARPGLTGNWRPFAPEHDQQQKIIINSPAPTTPQAPQTVTLTAAEIAAQNNFFGAPQSFIPALSTVFAPSFAEEIAQEQAVNLAAVPSPHKIIGNYNATYILIEHPEGLLLVDQHAAHERVLYELFANNFENVATIALMFPVIISRSADDIALLEPYFAIFKQNGIDIEPFGPEKIIIKATPTYFKDKSVEELIGQMVATMRDESATLDPATIKTEITKKLHMQMACKAAVKAGDVLTQETMRKLLNDLEKVENRFCCPHGRPTSWLIRLGEIERKFKRR